MQRINFQLSMSLYRPEHHLTEQLGAQFQWLRNKISSRRCLVPRLLGELYRFPWVRMTQWSSPSIFYLLRILGHMFPELAGVQNRSGSQDPAENGVTGKAAGQACQRRRDPML